SLDRLKEYAPPVYSNSKIFIKGSAKGKQSESENITIEADFSSDALTYRKMELKGISGNIKYTPEKAAIEFSAKNVCSGSMTGNIFVSFKNGPPAAFTLENSIKDMQLEEFFNTIFDKKQNVRGKTGFYIKLWGLAGKPETFDGEGSLTISDGRLWDMKLFDGIWQILVITNPELKKAVFTEADLAFKVKKQRVFIPDAVFSSEHFLLMPKGYIGFDKKIDFSIESGFFEGSEDSGADVLAKRIGNIKCRLTTIHATGTIEKPILKTEIKPLGEIFR
ncbi:MAG: hypothetical protein JW728_06090, partial [Candidatus Aureabacteria bacterium]|nr:hypothetical protein [Candidatus Auribacterota bacterium]